MESFAPNTSMYAMVWCAHEKSLTEKTLNDFAERLPSEKVIDVIEAVADALRIPVVDIIGPCRKREIVPARHLSMYISRLKTAASLKEIGRAHGKDHTTVLAAARKVRGFLEVHDQAFMPYWKKYLSKAPKHLLP